MEYFQFNYKLKEIPNTVQFITHPQNDDNDNDDPNNMSEARKNPYNLNNVFYVPNCFILDSNGNPGNIDILTDAKKNRALAKLLEIRRRQRRIYNIRENTIVHDSDNFIEKFVKHQRKLIAAEIPPKSYQDDEEDHEYVCSGAMQRDAKTRCQEKRERKKLEEEQKVDHVFVDSKKLPKSGVPRPKLLFLDQQRLQEEAFKPYDSTWTYVDRKLEEWRKKDNEKYTKRHQQKPHQQQQHQPPRRRLNNDKSMDYEEQHDHLQHVLDELEVNGGQRQKKPLIFYETHIRGLFMSKKPHMRDIKTIDEFAFNVEEDNLQGTILSKLIKYDILLQENEIPQVTICKRPTHLIHDENYVFPITVYFHVTPMRYMRQVPITKTYPSILSEITNYEDRHALKLDVLYMNLFDILYTDYGVQPSVVGAANNKTTPVTVDFKRLIIDYDYTIKIDIDTVKPKGQYGNVIPNVLKQLRQKCTLEK